VAKSAASIRVEVDNRAPALAFDKQQGDIEAQEAGEGGVEAVGGRCRAVALESALVWMKSG
jgi:hypothetical protein